jgi:putative two-component system response regulator
MTALGRIVVADDSVANRKLFKRLLSREGYVVHAAEDGAAALALVLEQLPDLVLSDVMMPVMDGFALCQRLKSDPATRLIPVVLVTALADRTARIAGINAGADDFLTKPVDPHELRARVRSLVNLKRFTDDLGSADSAILTLGLTVEARDPYTSGHCQRLAAYASALGAHLGLPADDIGALRRGGYLHDVGKIGIPDAILLKPGPLTPDEFGTLKQHTVIGETLCGDLRLLQPVRPIVRHHHERFDGSGYPDGLRGDAIPLVAQIMGIVDIYDALTTDRVYRKAMPSETAVHELRMEAEKGWRRRDLIDEFLALLGRGGLEQGPKSEVAR